MSLEYKQLVNFTEKFSSSRFSISRFFYKNVFATTIFYSEQYLHTNFVFLYNMCLCLCINELFLHILLLFLFINHYEGKKENVKIINANKIHSFFYF